MTDSDFSYPVWPVPARRLLLEYYQLLLITCEEDHNRKGSRKGRSAETTL